MKMRFCALVIFSLLLSSFQGGLAEQCGTQAGGALCADGLCCSQYGYCGTTAEYCCTGCQSQCNADVCASGGGGGSGEGGHISSKIFQGGLAEQCGTQAGGALCADGLCCSQYGYCGTTAEYCCTGCQSQCNADVCPSGGGGGSGEGGHISSKIFQGGLAEQCGTQAGGALCADGLCCSQYGYCGTTAEYCCTGCQSQCNADVCASGGGGGSGEGGHISSKIFQGGLAEQCGTQAGGALCADGLCCSQYGYCGTTAEYCCTGCQSQCNADVCPSGGGGGSGEGGHISSKIFQGGLAEQCGTQAGGALCADGLCCSQYGYCGTTAEYCCTGCQSQCNADVCPSGGGGGSGEGGHISSKIFQGGLAEQCGTQAGGALCADGLCCSQYGYCGTTAEYCCTGCQSQCNADVCAGGGGGGSGEGGHIGSIISSDDFDQLLPYRNDAACPAKNFYTYDAFIEAANSFPGFGTTGDTDIRKREIAAFLAQTSHETTGGWASAPGGPYSWGYCYVREINRGPYCEPNPNYPCASGQEYYGRGPIQLSWNYNYRQCGDYFKLDLLENPDLVATDPVISFKTAIWFWMTKQSPKPSCHEVITGTWNPTGVDIAAGRLPGYGTTTNIINGGLECGRGSNAQMEDRIGFYKRYCDILGVGYGDNLDCYSQSPFGNGLLVDTM